MSSKVKIRVKHPAGKGIVHESKNIAIAFPPKQDRIRTYILFSNTMPKRYHQWPLLSITNILSRRTVRNVELSDNLASDRC